MTGEGPVRQSRNKTWAIEGLRKDCWTRGLQSSEHFIAFSPELERIRGRLPPSTDRTSAIEPPGCNFSPVHFFEQWSDVSTLASCVLFGIFCHVLSTGTRMRREHRPDGDNYQKSRSSLQIDAFSQHSLSLPRISAPPISAGERRLA